MSTILVTGSAGFIGSNFVKVYKEKYPEVKIIGLDNLSSGKKELIEDGIEFIEGSILDDIILTKIFENNKIDYIFHFAAIPRVSFSVENPVATSEANITGFLKILDYARKNGVKRVILSSSSSVYGPTEKLPTKENENLANPLSPYALQKCVDEMYAKMFFELYGLETVCLRYFNVYGPNQFGDSPYSTVISAWLENLYFPKEGYRPYLEGDGSKSRDFAYVSDVVRANILASEAKGIFKGDIINVAGGKRVFIHEVRDLIEKYTEKKLDLEIRPDRLGDVPHTFADLSKAKELIGYEPEVGFEEGMKKTVEWFFARLSK
jgi:UDP-glucose 4-epimerase